MSATDVVGYTYQASTLCPDDVIAALPTGEGERFDGWALAPGIRMTPEDNLTELALAFGIDRMDEHTYDSEDFPKVIFESQVEDDERCDACGRALVGE